MAVISGALVLQAGEVTAAIPAPRVGTSGTSVVQKLGTLSLGRSPVSCFQGSPSRFAALCLWWTRGVGPVPRSFSKPPDRESSCLFPPIPNLSSFLVGWVAEPHLPLRAKPV